MRLEVGITMTAGTVGGRVMTGVVEKICNNTIVIAKNTDRRLVKICEAEKQGYLLQEKTTRV